MQKLGFISVNEERTQRSLLSPFSLLQTTTHYFCLPLLCTRTFSLSIYIDMALIFALSLSLELLTASFYRMGFVGLLTFFSVLLLHSQILRNQHRKEIKSHDCDRTI